ncbi:MAG: type 4a pilus biogenesis protein PilO [Proteobacteria bacterium]|nr:type 4a pilus biogenesis protein PilO [Pseudomonadota bacterium]MBU1709108.1 type 4a pilus biogenesis protein PilO [Pseudomonadota bacterium]
MSKETFKSAFDKFLETKVGRLDTKVKLAICAAAWVVPILLFVFLFVSPKNNDIRSLNSQKAKLEKEIAEAAAVAAGIDGHKKEMQKTELYFKVASLLLPQQQEIPGLLTNISGEGTNSGLNIMSFTPGGESPKEFYATIPITLDVRGPYHNIGLFLDKISKLPRIVMLTSLTMSSPSMVEGEMMLSSKLTLMTYRFIDKGNES